jgi:threonine synthase
VFLKNEILNPTGSFKDRQVSVGISKAREMGARTVAVVSSGNVAAAAAAYAAHAGMECYVFVARHAPETKLVQVKVCGAKAYRVDTAHASEIFSLVIAACKKFGWYHLSTAGMYNPFNVEGAKTIAYELYEQFADGLPEFVIVPVGGGGLLGAVWRGFTDLAELGLITRLPKLVGVQAAGCAPFVRAIQNGESPSETFGNSWTNPETIAGGIADDVVFDAHTAIPAVRNTGGTAVAVDDAQILAAERLLALTEGVFCEPSSATTIAALEPLREMNVLTDTSTVCCLITGGGFKDVESAQSLVEETRLIPAELSAIAHPISS